MNKNNKKKVWTKIGKWNQAWIEYLEHTEQKEANERRLRWYVKNMREGYPHEK